MASNPEYSKVKSESPEASEAPGLPRGSIKEEEAEDEGVVDFGDIGNFGDADEDANEDADEGDNINASLDGTTLWEDSGFKIKQIGEPQVVHRSMEDLHRLILGNHLILDTKYQRQVVWDEHRASAFIASVLQRYYYPPVVFNLKNVDEPDPENEGSMIRKCCQFCIDGKQRLTSIKKFMEGELGVFDSAVPAKKWFYCHPKVSGILQISTNLILPEATKKFFRESNLVTYEYSNLSTQVEETMFQLLQKGMPLTPAERMRALSTDWAKFAKQFEVDYPKLINLCTQKRASGFRCLVVIFGQIIEVLRPKSVSQDQIPVLQSRDQIIFGLLQNNQSLNEGIKKTCKEVLDRFQKVVDLCIKKSRNTRTGFKVIPNSAFDPAPNFLRERGVGHVKSFSPLERLATTILILVYSKTRSDVELIDDIKELRVYLRKEYKDLRLNNKCWGTAWQYIDLEMKNRQGEDARVQRNRDADDLDAVDGGDLLEQGATISRTRKK